VADNRVRKMFCGVGAVVTRLRGKSSLLPHHFDVITIVGSEEADFGEDSAAPKNHLRIDLDRSPQKGAWNQVMVDDRGIKRRNADGNVVYLGVGEVGYRVTSLGPNFPTGTFVGGLYVESDFFKAKRGVIDRDNKWPTSDYEPPELVTIAYQNNSANNGQYSGLRYAGFWAEIVTPAVSPGTIARIKVFRAGLQNGQRDVAGTWNFDFADPLQCDGALEPTFLSGLTPNIDLLKPDQATGTKGAIFIELGEVAAFYDYTPYGQPYQGGLVGPKIPFWQGG
jgi:hypothetical protein